MALDTIMNIADAFNENEQLKPLMDLINQIMEMDDNSLNEQSVGIILGSINGAFTPAITDTAVKSMIQQFEEQGTTRRELITGAETFKQGIQDLIDLGEVTIDNIEGVEITGTMSMLLKVNIKGETKSIIIPEDAVISEKVMDVIKEKFKEASMDQWVMYEGANLFPEEYHIDSFMDYLKGDKSEKSKNDLIEDMIKEAKNSSAKYKKEIKDINENTKLNAQERATRIEERAAELSPLVKSGILTAEEFAKLVEKIEIKKDGTVEIKKVNDNLIEDAREKISKEIDIIDQIYDIIKNPSRKITDKISDMIKNLNKSPEEKERINTSVKRFNNTQEMYELNPKLILKQFSLKANAMVQNPLWRVIKDSIHINEIAGKKIRLSIIDDIGVHDILEDVGLLNILTDKTGISRNELIKMLEGKDAIDTKLNEKDGKDGKTQLEKSEKEFTLQKKVFELKEYGVKNTNGKEYTLELNRDSFLKIDQLCNIQKSMNIVGRGFYKYYDNEELTDDFDLNSLEIKDDEIEKEVELKEKTLKWLSKEHF